MVKGQSPMWRTDAGRINSRTGEAVKYPVTDPSQLPRMELPPVSDDGGTGEWEHFTAVFVDENDDIELVPVLARDIDDALNLALEQRKGTEKVKTAIMHDGLGEAVKKLMIGLGEGVVSGARGAARVGAKAGQLAAAGVAKAGELAYEGARGTALVTGRAAASYRTLKREYQIGRLEQLIKDAGSENPARRAVAKMQMQQEYPNVYRHIAWTRV